MKTNLHSLPFLPEGGNGHGHDDDLRGKTLAHLKSGHRYDWPIGPPFHQTGYERVQRVLATLMQGDFCIVNSGYRVAHSINKRDHRSK